MASSMSSEQWDRLSPLLDSALQLEPAAREAWLTELTAKEPGLATIVRELLAEKALLDTDGFLEKPPAGMAEQTTLAGQQFGAYELERLIGQGGMGSVWLARRADGRFEGKAAVKLLNAALIGGPAEQRFVREGSVVAGLQHPNIAHLIDAGVAAGRQPYLVFEHVEGIPIDQYCDANRLDIRARIRVFLDALEAVAYAHRHLIVHRDLKPSNILVTGDGIVKLLDFGIATLLEPAAAATAGQDVTREIGAALTPEYAAPEQLLGQAVTTATDVYALGRVLYVLLGGPLTAMPHGRSPAELVRNNLEREPPLLSEAATSPGMKRLLRGDLANIARKALKNEPQERYPAVEAFADDLRRYLANEPVSARPDSFGYRAGKFVRRHRGRVLSGAITAVALIVTTAFALLQMLEAQRQRDEAEAATQRAQGFSTAITSILSQTGPEGRALTPHELLGRAVEQVEATYADDPAFLVHMLTLISGRYYDLENTNEEYATLLKAEGIARKSGDPFLIFKVQCNTVETELALGRKDEALRRLDQAFRLLPLIRDVPALDHAVCLRARAEIARADGDLARALEHFEEARRVLEANGRTAGNIYAGILSGLAAYNAQAGSLLAAHDYSLKLVDLDKRLGRQNSVPGLIARSSLASVLYRLGQVRRAESMHREAAAESLLPGMGKMLYGQVLARRGQHDTALRLIREGLGEIEEGGNQAYVIRARFALAESLFLIARPAEAGQALAEATALMQKDEAKYGHHLVDAHRLRADLLLAAGRLGEAEEEVSTAVQRHRAAGRDESRRAAILLTQARIRLAQTEPQRAAESARGALALFEKNTIDPEQSADVGETLLVLAQAELAAGDTAAARGSLERATVSLRNGLGAGHRLTLLSEGLLANLP